MSELQAKHSQPGKFINPRPLTEVKTFHVWPSRCSSIDCLWLRL